MARHRRHTCHFTSLQERERERHTDSALTLLCVGCVGSGREGEQAGRVLQDRKVPGQKKMSQGRSYWSPRLPGLQQQGNSSPLIPLTRTPGGSQSTYVPLLASGGQHHIEGEPARFILLHHSTVLFPQDHQITLISTFI